MDYKDNNPIKTTMSKVKYRVREFTPKANQGGTHSFFAEAVFSTDIDATELARI